MKLNTKSGHYSPSNLMRERIEGFNRFVFSQNMNEFPAGLFCGKMGLCIYFYELGRFTSDKTYTGFAEKLLDNVLDNISVNVAIDPENGLTGICLAINYLLSEGFVEGDPNKVLKDFDGKIIQSLLFNRLFDHDKNLNLGAIILRLGSLAYLSIRLQNDGISREERLIMENVLIENINKIEAMETDKFTEPALFSVTGYFSPLYLQLLLHVYNLGFYNYKIEKIIDGLTPHFLYRFPLDGANRLSLCRVMAEMAVVCENAKGWKRHIDLLEKSVDIPETIHCFRNKNIAFPNGLCGFYYLLKKRGQNSEYSNMIRDKIVKSTRWEYLSDDKDALRTQIGLYSGIPGIILTYLDILRGGKDRLYFDTAVTNYV